MISVLTFTLLASLTSPAQIVGGGFETLHQWNGSNTADSFGSQVSNAGDVNADGLQDILVSAPYAEYVGIYSAGSVYLYSGADGALLYQWNGAADGDQLGSSIAAAGDVNADGFDDVILGSKWVAHAGLPYVGAAYVYSGADGSLLHQWRGVADRDQFGSAVSSAGDVDGDGYADLLVGAVGVSPPTHLGVGAAYVFSGRNGSQLHLWLGTDDWDSFGSSVSELGDINGDGFDDVLIGVPGEDPGNRVDAGSVFAYSGATGALLYRWDGEAASDNFGTALASAGDLNQDNTPDVIIGAPFATSTSGLNRAGSIYMFSGADGTLIRKGNGRAAGDNFGISVSGAGDVNGDHFDDIVVGAYLADPGWHQAAGSAYIYSGLDGALLHQADGFSLVDLFGSSVAGAGDTNGDGLADVIIGAPSTNLLGLPNSGSAFLIAFNPFLRVNPATISAATGGTLSYALDFPSSAGGHVYKVLLSASGTGPTNYGVDIPLTLDRFVRDSFFGNYPLPTHTNMHGTLDAFGDANASLTVPAGVSAALVGHTFHFAAIANAAGQLPERSSIALAIEIMP